MKPFACAMSRPGATMPCVPALPQGRDSRHKPGRSGRPQSRLIPPIRVDGAMALAFALPSGAAPVRDDVIQFSAEMPALAFDASDAARQSFPATVVVKVLRGGRQ